MDEEDREKVNITDEQWVSHRNLLIKAESEQAASLDKHILTLSSGAIGLSVIFFFKLTDKVACSYVYCFFAAWICFAVAMVSTLFSFIASQAAYCKRLEEWDDVRDTQSYDRICLKDNSCEKLGRILSIIAISTFVLGIFFFAAFAARNVVMSNSNGELTMCEKPPKPPEAPPDDLTRGGPPIRPPVPKPKPKENK